MMHDKIAIHCFVSGKVQGVWFRASTQEQAKKLQLTGWVRNLPDGRVEVLACGNKPDVLQLYEWLKHGPPLARITDVACEETAWQDLAEFVVR
jgi:acylphosphatase